MLSESPGTLGNGPVAWDDPNPSVYPLRQGQGPTLVMRVDCMMPRDVHSCSRSAAKQTRKTDQARDKATIRSSNKARWRFHVA